MKAFRLIWFGQLVSIFGSEVTVFALAIWVWQETGQVTALALIPVFGWLPDCFLGRWPVPWSTAGTAAWC
jgi:hypothetical protein